ncbi:hypothetical protein M2137_000790 [Parabacteroides sp. PFB2-10]|uniref:hypothetical protein n=1 Tax=Parabacteroides sp. PFB2-10 TaxID=1742405 RepID=UPI00247673F4|nr:hypothetical protein [Parabacteroides sp. PFB2-10]MDH6312027.1 hypothetical protein [Parabacteroides sp. PFB2-10]MDL2244175.1 hypothetical protein [Parabacteroides sp. OttesenSCG-928-J18]
MKNFPQFISYLREKEQKRELIILSILLSILGIVYYQLYPFPFLYPDSATYVFSAYKDMFTPYRPMGYSHYLQLVHALSGSISALFVVTYIIHMVASLFFLYSFKYLIGLRNRYIFYVLCLFVFLSPTILFSTNYLMSDCLFNSLTMLFLATAIWLIYSRNFIFILIHLFTLYILYNLRYSGMFYVPVSMCAIFISYQKQNKLMQIGLMCLPLVLFFFMQDAARKNYKKNTSVNITSAFSGWQLMNNASVLIPETKHLPSSTFDTQKEKLLHDYFKQVPDSLFTTQSALTTDLMWNNDSPLKIFNAYYMHINTINYGMAWVQVGDVYSDYAKKIIFKYPFSFLHKFVIPSFLSFFQFKEIVEEHIEFKNEEMYREYYGIQMDTFVHTPDYFTRFNPVRHIFNYIYWILFTLSVVCFISTTRKASWNDHSWRLAFLLLLFILIYIGVSALASPNTTWRYALPIYVPSLFFMVYVALPFLEKWKPRKQES